MGEIMGNAPVIIITTCLLSCILMFNVTEARVLLIKYNCTSTPCDTTEKSPHMEDVKQSEERLERIRNEIESKYNELEDQISNALKPEECMDLVRLLYCRSMPFFLPTNLSCDVSHGDRNEAHDEDGIIAVKTAAECKAYLSAWADAVKAAITSENQALRVSQMNHVKRMVKDKSRALIANLNRARKLMQQHSVNILVRGAIEPVELDKEKPSRSPHENFQEMRRPDFFTIISRSMPRDSKIPTGPFVPWRHGSVSAMIFNNSTALRSRIASPNPIFLRSIQGLDKIPESKVRSFQNEQRTGLMDDSTNFQAHRFVTLVAPVIFMCSILVLLLWLCCNLRRYFGTREPPQYSYNFKYSAVPGNDGVCNAKESKSPPVPIQGFLGSVDPHAHMMHHI